MMNEGDLAVEEIATAANDSSTKNITITMKIIDDILAMSNDNHKIR